MFIRGSILFSIFLLFCSYTIHAQQSGCNLVLKGQITLKDTGQVAANGVSVTIPKLQKGVITDSAGKFVFDNLCPGKLELVVTFQGYRTLDTILSISNDLMVNFPLFSNAEQLNGVTVTSEIIRKDQVSTAVKTTLTGQALEETRGLSLGESLKTITGVNSIQTGPTISKPVIHGVYSNRILIVNNGIRQEGQNWGNDHAPEIDPFIATKITIVKGPASIIYGSDAIGGVILLDPKDLRSVPGVDGELDLVGMTNGRMGAVSGMIEGAADNALKGLSWRVQGTLKKAGNFQTANYYMGNTGFYEDDYSATLNFNKPNYGAQMYYSRFDTKIGIASASHIGTLADLYEAFQRSEPAVKSGFTYDITRPYQTVNHELFKTSGYMTLGNNMGKLDAVYAFQSDIRKEYDADISFNDSLARLNPPDLYFKLFTNTVDLIWEHPAIDKKIVGSIGVNFISHGNSQEGTGYQELIPNFVDYGGGAFIIEKWEINKLLLEGGIRYDYRWLRAYTVNATTLVENTPTYIWQNISTNFGASYRFSDKFSTVLNFGTAWRPPQVIELFANGIHQSAASYERGDTSLNLEKAYNTSLGFKYSTDHFEVEFGTYINYFNNYIYLKPDSVPIQTIQGAFPSYTYTQVNALFEGIDLNISYSFLNHLILNSKTTIVRARNLNIHDWLINIPADRFDNTLKYQLLSMGKCRNVFISINNLIVLQQTRVPPKSDYVPPPPGYMLWGASAGCSIPIFGKFMDISLTVTNLTNVSYRDYLNRFRYYLDDLGRNFSLRLTVPFELSHQHG
jgi:iron complex outermembrane receptor protein